MQVRRLEHYNIRTTKFDETVKFYDDVLGMKAKRPDLEVIPVSDLDLDAATLRKAGK